MKNEIVKWRWVEFMFLCERRENAMSMVNWLDPLLLVILSPGTDHNKNTFTRVFNNATNANDVHCETEYSNRRVQSLNKNTNTNGVCLYRKTCRADNGGMYQCTEQHYKW
jgi:hypothetical protein